MRKAITAALIAGLVAGTLAMPAEAKKKKKPKVITFEVEGAIQGMNPAGAVLFGITEGEFREVHTCTALPATQGVDGFVFEVPADFQAGTATFDVTASDATGTYDLDAYFYSASCDLLEPHATDGADPSGAIPPGAAWGVVDAFAGAQSTFTLTATATK
jgi:hypothetical protein